jgi:hypothetical protein
MATGPVTSYLKRLIAVCLLGTMPLCSARADVLICESETHSANTLVVTIPEPSYATFVQLVQSAEIIPVKERFTYGGGIDSNRVTSWGLNNKTHTIGIYADYVKETKRFEFWIQTCGTKASWRPYWRALFNRVQGFPGAKLELRPIRES